MTRPDLKSLCNNLEQKVSELPRVPYRAIIAVGLIATIGYSRVQPLIQANNHRIGGNPTELEYQPSQELNNFDLSGCVQSGQIERTELMDCLKLESMRLIDFEHTYYEANPSPDKTKELATIENVDQYIAKILPRLLPLFDRKLIIQEITNQAKSGQYTPSELISMAGELMDYRLFQVEQLNQNLLRYTGQIYTHGQIGEVNQLREVYKNTFHNFSQERVRVIFAEYFPELKNLSKDTVLTWQDFYNKAVTFKLMNLRARLNLVTSHLKHNSQHTSLEDVEMLGEILGQKDTDEQKKATLDYMAQLHGRGYAKDDNITTRGYLESQVRDVIHRKAMANQGKTPVQKEVEGGLNHGRFIRPFLPAKISFHREYNSDGTYGDVTSLQNVLGSEVQNDNLHNDLKIGLARTWSAEGLEALAHSNGTNILYQRYTELVTDKSLDIANSQWTANSNPIIGTLASGLNLANWPAMNTQSGQYKHIITYNYRPLVDCLFRCTVQEIDPKVYQLFDNKSPNQALPYLSLYLYRYGQGLPVPNVEFYSHIATVTEPALSAFYNLIIKPIEPILNELGLLMAEVALAIILPELIGAIAAESTVTRSLRYSGAVTGPRPSGGGGGSSSSSLFRTPGPAKVRVASTANNSFRLIENRTGNTIIGPEVDKLTRFGQTQDRLLTKLTDTKFQARTKLNDLKERFARADTARMGNCFAGVSRDIPWDVAVGLTGVAEARIKPCMEWKSIEDNKRLIKNLRESANSIAESDKLKQISEVGRAIQKHSNRNGSVYPKSDTQTPNGWNQHGEKFFDSMLDDSRSTYRVITADGYDKVLELKDSYGRVAWFKVKNGRIDKFITFREP